MSKFLAILLLLTGCATCALAQAPGDVSMDHWAYDAVSELAGKGYLQGYPDGNFRGDRSLSRYEFATVVKRILDEVNDRLASVGAKTSTPTTTTSPQAKPSVTPEDLAVVKKLVDEFKVELTVIGTRLDDMDATISELKSKLDMLDAVVTDDEGSVQTAISDVKKMKKVAVSGYVQARFNLFRNDPDKSTPGTEPTDNFSVRRARLKLVGKVSDKSSATLQLDAGQGSKGDAGPAVSLKDAFLTYNFAGDPTLGLSMQMGQQKWPFGYEVVQSSSVRETPERSMIVQKLFPGERDRGFMISYPVLDSIMWYAGVFNGNETKYKDVNNNKDLVSSLRMDLGDLQVGVSGYYGKGVVDGAGALYLANEDPKRRWGADAQYYMDRISLKGEYIKGRGVDGVGNATALYDPIDGYYAQLNFNVTQSDVLVAKYDTISLDPKNVKYGRRSAWNLGLIHYLDDKTRLKFFYQINEEEKAEFNNDTFVAEWITTF